jgi:hypothetical protein
MMVVVMMMMMIRQVTESGSKSKKYKPGYNVMKATEYFV